MANPQYTTEFINSLVKRSGKSRASVYRKLKDGWTEAEIAAGRMGIPDAPGDTERVELPDAILEPPADDVKFAVTWAQAVLWAADNVDTSKKMMTKQRAGSALRYNLFLLGKDDLRELHVNLVPKALNILDKNRSPEGGNIAAAEEMAAAELLHTLKIALEESNLQYVGKN
jgi:hypothetical protein